MVETTASARSFFLILKMFIMLRIFYALSIFAFVSPEGFSYLKYEYSLLERSFLLKKDLFLTVYGKVSLHNVLF